MLDCSVEWYHKIDEALVLAYAVKKGPTFHTFQNGNKKSIIHKPLTEEKNY